ncbi:glycosyltransferase family 4 protein [Spirosoma pollinicola]|uniref:Group 1 glycosyl transferase n=1 Tax=Spirosoma pollinicola TaxID=2057025 RepID=A0A2K8Z8I7_9BACT|nr:glycosyltransferase family 4 protein [Spirosoma pollinicola]AUD06185.1 group 1 glycosyl transferase [Spirosoma pollinicola]
MRVLLIHNYYQQGGGEDTIFKQEVDLLREYGIVVETLTFDNESFDGTLVGNVQSAVQALYNFQSGRRLDHVISQFLPDIVHIHNLFYTASAAVIRTAKKRQIPVVMTLHNYRLVCVNGLLMRGGETPCEVCLTKTIPLAGIRNACFQNSKAKSAHLSAITLLHKLTGIWKQVDRFVVLTDFTHQKILSSSLKLQPEQVCVKPNFVADAGYTGPEGRGDFFLYAGRLTVEKGVDVLLQAAEKCGFPLEIIGDGPLAVAVQQMSEQVPTIRYRGKQPREAVLEAINHCRALLVPSRWYEGLPTVILEAFASGTPVICSDQQNLNQIVKDGQTGLLFRTGDSVDLGQTISRFRLDKSGQSILSQNAYIEYQTRYAKNVALQATLDLYDALIDKQKISKPLEQSL